MNKLLYLTVLILWACTNQSRNIGSQVSVTPTTSAIPTRWKQLGFYRITDEKRGITVAFIPFLSGNLKRARYKRYEFSADWRKIVTDGHSYELRFTDSKQELTNLSFELKGSPVEVYIGTLSKRSVVKAPLSDCSWIQGIPVMDDDVFETKLPQVDEDLYFLPLIKNLNPFDKVGKELDFFRLSRSMNLKVGTIFSEDDNRKIILTTKTNSLQDFYLLRQWSPIGSPVFSKKTQKIVGFIENYTDSKQFNINGEFNIRIKSIMSRDLQQESEIPQKTTKLPFAEQIVKTSVSDEWKKIYCSKESVNALIRRRIKLEEEREHCAPESPPHDGLTEPRWSDHKPFPLCDEDSQMRALGQIKQVIARDQARAAAPAGCSWISDPKYNTLDDLPQTQLPLICAREVDDAIKAYIQAEKSCPK